MFASSTLFDKRIVLVSEDVVVHDIVYDTDVECTQNLPIVLSEEIERHLEGSILGFPGLEMLITTVSFQ